MADLKIRGRSEGFDDVANDFGKVGAKAVAMGTLIADGLKAATRAAVDFAKESVTAFAEQEKADKRLSSAIQQLGYKDVPGLTASLKAQASQFQETLGVSDDMVEGLQELMVRFGVAPAKIQATTQAVLD